MIVAVRVVADKMSVWAGTVRAVLRAAEREAHQRRLNEMLEETLRQIQRTRAHSQQKFKHVRESTKSYVARFEHDMSCVNEDLRCELVERTKRIDGIVDGLSV